MIVCICVSVSVSVSVVREQEKRDENQINLLIYGPVDLSRHFFPTYRSERIRIYVLITVSQKPRVRPSLSLADSGMIFD